MLTKQALGSVRDCVSKEQGGKAYTDTDSHSPSLTMYSFTLQGTILSSSRHFTQFLLLKSLWTPNISFPWKKWWPLPVYILVANLSPP